MGNSLFFLHLSNEAQGATKNSQTHSTICFSPHAPR